MRKLEVLNISFNNFTDVPYAVLEDLKELKHFFVTGNHLLLFDVSMLIGKLIRMTIILAEINQIANYTESSRYTYCEKSCKVFEVKKGHHRLVFLQTNHSLLGSV